MMMADELGIPVVEGNVTPYDLSNPDETLTASTSPTPTLTQIIRVCRFRPWHRLHCRSNEALREKFGSRLVPLLLLPPHSSH